MDAGMSRRILHIVPSLQYSGALRQLTLLHPALRAAGYDSHVVSLCVRGSGPMAAELAACGLTVHSSPLPRHQIRPIAASMRELLQELLPEMIHTWSPEANRWGRLPTLLLKAPPLIASLRVSQERAGFLQRQLDRRLDQRTSRFLCNSHITRRVLEQNARGADAVHLVPNAVRIPAPPLSNQRQVWSERWQIPADAKWIAAVGPLTPIKRIKDLIWATDLIKVMRPDVYLVIMGEGPHRWRLQKYCDQARIQDRVVFAGNVADLPNQLGMFDCLWHASAWESCPNAVLEAMAAGIPVVGADCEGTRQLVQDGRHGALVPIGDRPAFARATLPLLEDAARARELGLAAQQYVAAHYSIQAAVDAYLTLLRSSAS
jgi:glycosyltransferase involved in cell wall biosynthesis